MATATYSTINSAAPDGPLKQSSGAVVVDTIVESEITLADNTTNNVSSAKHGFAPKSAADATKFLNSAATPAYAQVKDSDLSTTDITTNNVSTSKHGFAPKLPSDATKYLDGTGAYTVPAGSGGGTNASYQATPSDPTGTTDGTGKMMGLAGSITPTNTGKVFIVISGTMTNSASSTGTNVRLRYGTGTAPTNGASLTGTVVGGTASEYFASGGGGNYTPFSVNAIVTGLSVSTAYWLDVQVSTIAGGTSSLTTVSISAHEF